MIRRLRARCLLLLACMPAAACRDASSKPAAPPPAKSEAVAHESELLKLTLTADAQRRLGIRTVRVGRGAASRERVTGGEVVVPPTAPAGVPIGSTSDLAQIGTGQAAADGEVARTEALVRLGRIAYNRADALVREEAGSVRARDEAAANLATANAAAGAARAQRRLLGPPIATIVAQRTLWVRVPVFGTDVRAIARGSAARLRPLGDERAPPRTARPVQAPPSANAVAGTLDLFYAFDNRDRAFRPGQRVAVSLPIGGATEGVAIPTGAIVRDIYGGEWVYRRSGPNAFVRERVDVAGEGDGRAILARGLAPGAEIVVEGAAELFGTEFGTPH